MVPISIPLSVAYPGLSLGRPCFCKANIEMQLRVWGGLGQGDIFSYLQSENQLNV